MAAVTSHRERPGVSLGLPYPCLAKHSESFFLSIFLQLIQRDFLGSFTMALRVCFLLFEGLRTQLKFQMEV